MYVCLYRCTCILRFMYRAVEQCDQQLSQQLDLNMWLILISANLQTCSQFASIFSPLSNSFRHFQLHVLYCCLNFLMYFRDLPTQFSRGCVDLHIPCLRFRTVGHLVSPDPTVLRPGVSINTLPSKVHWANIRDCCKTHGGCFK